MVIRNPNQTERGLHTASEIAEMLSVEPRTIHNWATSGIIPVAVRAGKTIRFNLDDVTQALNEVTGKTQRDKQLRAEAKHSVQRSVVCGV